MEDRPLDIQRFELLQLTCVFVGLIHSFAVGLFGVIGPIFSALISVTLTLLISRGRKNWARWALLVMFLIGVAGLVVGSFFGLTQRAWAVGYPALTILTWLLQIAALTLLFTSKSDSWLRSKPAQV
jgi:cytochrome c oxidase subunit IV